ncbi:MAG: ABC transporter ATP-binding protein [Nocardioidaceae bacterium]|nr:ABC transporter ATP-binding protein [Nocardioidaceae bacterium]
MLPRPLSRARLGLFGILVGIGVGQAVAAITIGLLVERGFELLVTNTGTVTASVAVPIAAGLGVGVLLTAVLRGVERPVAELLGQRYVVEVRETLFTHLTRVPARELGRRSRGSMLMRFVGDIAALRSWVSLGLARLLVGGLAVGLSTLLLMVINVALGATVGGVLLAGGLATWAASPRLMRKTRHARRHQSRLTGEVTERLTQIAVLQASGQERREGKRVKRKSSRVADAMVSRAGATGVSRAVAEGTAALCAVSVLLVGAIEVRAGRASPGAVVAAVSIAGLLAGHLRDLGRVAEYAAGARVAREAATRFLDMSPLADPPGAPALDVRGGEVQLRDVVLGEALCGVNLHAAAGQTIAVVGPNGAGKSTLVALASRMVDPDEGQVRIDDQDLRTRSLSSVRKAVGLAGPDLPLLRGSMDRNVRYRLPRCDEDEVARVAALCELQAVADDLPDGWRSDVGEGGSRLSAGQRARLTIARAALGRPAVLVLDEAEAHLDRDAAGVVDRVLADHHGTALVVTHRRELAQRADQIWCLINGRVAEVGPPGQLLNGTGPTARLFARHPEHQPGELPAERPRGDDLEGHEHGARVVQVEGR